MIHQIIKQYLSDHRRLVIPSLGAFVVKSDSHKVIFSELLKRDDGVLREALRQSGMGELECEGAISRLLFEIRRELPSSGQYTIEGLGVFSQSPNGAINFDGVVDGAATTQPATPTPSEPQTVEPEVKEQVVENELPLDHSNEEPTELYVEPLQVTTPEESQEPTPEEEIEELVVDSRDTHTNDENKKKRTPNLLHPEPCIEGLQYGRPHKNTNGYDLVGRDGRRGGIDKFVVIAVVALVIAIAAFLYGYVQDMNSIEQGEAQESFESQPEPKPEAERADIPMDSMSQVDAEQPLAGDQAVQ